MKPRLLTAPRHLSPVKKVLACPEHPMNWIEEHMVSGEFPDTTQFCNCCTMDCTPFCRSCTQWDTEGEGN